MSNLFASLTQTTRLLRLHTPLGPDRLIVECLRGSEAIGQCYVLELTAVSTDAAIPLKSLLGQPVLLELDTALPTGPRCFHGHVTQASLVGADGGLARYALTIGPWCAFLGHGRDSRVFQDLSVPDILSALFARWQGAGTLAPAWRFDLADPASYPRRSLTCQYQESDFAFAERLLGEEGLFYYFEHSGDAAAPGLGSHTLVIADHNGSFQPNAQPVVRFTQPGAVMREDSMDRWRSESRWSPDGVALSSWDYRSLGMRDVHATASTPDPVPVATRETAGAYAYPSREHGQRLADRHMEALETLRQLHTGAGTVRTFVPGTTFTLTGQASLDAAAADDERTFVVARVLHLAHNNLSAQLGERTAQLLGRGALASAILSEQQHGLHAVGAGAGERPLYRNRIDAVRASVPFRQVPRHRRPAVQGQQTAIVVGPPGAVVHTDRDHRIKVQFHWQRGAQSHSRLEHPAPDGHTGAPGDDTSGTWVRVATPLAPVAGANWGTVALPRVGTEVLVDFIDGDIDRPVVIGSLYNGRGQADAQYNQVSQGPGAATGNASPWFPGNAGAHAHPAVLSGLKSQALAASQQGAGPYSQMVFDDTPGEARVALQRHASAHAGTDELNLGHLRHQADNQRLAPAGFGAELKSTHGAALRAGQGMLLSADVRHGGAAAQLDSAEARAQVELSGELQRTLAGTAQQHNARLKGATGDEPAPEVLPALAATADVAKVLRGSAGGATAYDRPHLQLSTPAGIAATTPASAILLAGGTSSLTAGQDLDMAAQGNAVHGVRDGISLFTYGKAAAGEKPNQETGIRLHAASGKASVQAQSDAARLTADKAITVASVAQGVTVAAKEHVMLTAQGAYLKLEGGNIMLHGPGTIAFKASMKELAGPASSSYPLPLMPRSEGEVADQHFVLKSHSGKPVPNRRYRAYTGNSVVEGFTDEQGRSSILDGYLGQIARFELIDITHDEHFVIRDPLGEPVANMPYRIRSAGGVEVMGRTDEEGRTSLFTSDKIEEVELLFVPEAYPEDDGVD